MVWKFFRSWVVLALFFASLLSILFSGALDIHELSSETGHGLKEVVVRNLFIASVVMAMHALYLGVMLYHLIFRRPVNLQRWLEGLAFCFIAFGYLFHVAHDYFEGTEAFESSTAWGFLSPTLFFAAAYSLMAYLGWRQEPQHEEERPALHHRERWMRWTDTGMVILLLGLSWWELMRGAPARVSPIAQAWYSQLFSHSDFQFDGRLLRWVAPKDLAILIALVIYWLTRILLKRHLEPEHPDFRLRMLEQHKLDEGEKLPDIKAYLEEKLPAKSVWLDFKCEYGIHLEELFNLLDLKPHQVVIPEESETNDRVIARLGSVVTPKSFPKRSAAVMEMLSDINLIHIANVAYRSSASREVLRFLSHARRDTILLLRYTSGASYYRAVSSSMSCAPIRPYVHHAIHQCLIKDLEKQDWLERGELATVIKCYLQHLEIDQTQQHVVNWVESQYGEFSGDIIERYLKAFSEARQTELKHFELMRVFVKQ